MNGQSTMRPKGGESALVNRLVVKLIFETASPTGPRLYKNFNWKECSAYSNRMFNEIKLITLPNKSS
jgi:hypothetical protein